jgi:hypothetical protein
LSGSVNTIVKTLRITTVSIDDVLYWWINEDDGYPITWVATKCDEDVLYNDRDKVIETVMVYALEHKYNDVKLP